MANEQNIQSQYAEMTQTYSKLIAQMKALRQRLHGIGQMADLRSDLAFQEQRCRTGLYILMLHEDADWASLDIYEPVVSERSE